MVVIGAGNRLSLSLEVHIFSQIIFAINVQEGQVQRFIDIEKWLFTSFLVWLGPTVQSTNLSTVTF